MNSKSKRTIVVTGGSKGIGQAICIAFAAPGTDIFFNFSSEEATGRQTENKISAAGGSARGMRVNVASEKEVSTFFKTILDQTGRIDVLINNAGITRDNLLLRMKEKDWDAVMDVNLKGAFLCIKSASRTMVQQRFGRIINITSIAAKQPINDLVISSSLRPGILGLSRVLNDDPRRLHRLVASRLDGRPGDRTSLFLSFSPPGDPVAPPGGQTLTVSTHVEAGEWEGLAREAYLRKKEGTRVLLREALEREVPGLASAVAYEDAGTPRTFRRYTRRSGGSVGGLRTTRDNFALRALDPTLGAAGLHVVGDTAFPGQGTLAVAMSAAIAAERLGAVRLGRDGRVRLVQGGTR